MRRVHLRARRNLRAGATQRVPTRRPALSPAIVILTVAASDSVYLNVVPFLYLNRLTLLWRLAVALPNSGVRPPTLKR